MAFRFSKRINLGGGLGINLSKSGVSVSLRTPFGTLGTKGVSVKTGIPGLSMRHGFKAPQQQSTSTPEDASEMADKFDRVMAMGEYYSAKHEYAKRWKDVSIKSPTQEFELCNTELTELFTLGTEVQRYLEGLRTWALEHRPSVYGPLNDSIKTIQRTQEEIESLLLRLAELQDRKEGGVIESTKPAAAESGTDLDVVRFNCQTCNQPIEVNSSARGQEFRCPSCGGPLMVPEN